MNTLLYKLLASRQKEAAKQLEQQVTMRPYGLHVRSTFPLPIQAGIMSEAKYASNYSWQDFNSVSSAHAQVFAQHFCDPFNASDLPHTKFIEAHINNGSLLNLDQTYTDPITITISSTKPTSIAYVFIIAQPGSSNSVLIRHDINAPSHTIVNIVCLEHSSLELILSEPESELPHFSLQHSSLYNGAQLKTLQIVHNSTQLQTQIHCDVGPAATISQNHIISACLKQQHDIFSRIKHTGEGGRSKMNSAVVLRDQAHTIYRGLVDLTATALNTSSTQKEHTLLLSPAAKIDVVPMLEIVNDTISCTHSASVSNLDLEQLFYLQSRGFSHKEAEKVLVQGFWENILQEFSPRLRSIMAELY